MEAAPLEADTEGPDASEADAAPKEVGLRPDDRRFRPTRGHSAEIGERRSDTGDRDTSRGASAIDPQRQASTAREGRGAGEAHGQGQQRSSPNARPKSCQASAAGAAPQRNRHPIHQSPKDGGRHHIEEHEPNDEVQEESRVRRLEEGNPPRDSLPLPRLQSP